jgi:hypothetical protein
MTITPHNLQNESPTDELAMLLVGDYKSGKSRLAGTAPGNILFLETDLRLAALRTHPNVKNIYGLEFADNLNDPKKPPTAFNEELDILNKLEKSPYLRDIHKTFESCGDKLVDTIVFDSVQTMSDNARRYVMYNAPDVAKTFSMGVKTYRVAASFHAWGGEMEMVTGAILQARALLHCKKCLKSVTYKRDASGMDMLFHTDSSLDNPEIAGSHAPAPRAMNVIVILHECMEQDERSTLDNPMYTGKIEVYPRRYNVLLKYFNEVWRLSRESGGAPKIAVDPDGKFVQAASAFGVKVTVPDISQVLRDARSLQKK